MRSFVVVLLMSVVPVCSGQEDVVVQKRGDPLKGMIWEEGQDEVVVNVFRTAIRRVKRGTERVPAKRVKRVVRRPHPHRDFWRQAKALREADADAWVKLGQDAAKKKLKGLASHAFTEALVRAQANEEARKGLGRRLKKLLQEDPRLNKALADELAVYMKMEGLAERESTYKNLQKLGEARPFHYFERCIRSSRIAKGRQDKRILTFRSEETSGTYCLFVPKSYDPLLPVPLVIGLHGGGTGGKDRDLVVGSGEAAMGFYQDAARRLGWLVACPTANRAPWSARENDPLILALVEEMCLSFNVDRNRIYLAGHSLGGFGTWHHGPKYAHLWAAIAPAAGGGRPDFQRLAKTMTGVYCYHGADDAVVGPDSDRRAADAMLQKDLDFVYCEIPDSGHGWPRDVRGEMWDFFQVRRLAVAPGRKPKGRFAITQETYSSFLTPPTKEETRYFGHPTKPAAASADLKVLLRDLDAGGGLANKAAEQLAKLDDKKAAGQVARRLGPKSTPVTRRLAAEVLGRMGQPVGAKALQKVLTDDDLALVGAAARALGSIPAKGTPKAWLRCARDLDSRFAKKKAGGAWDFSDYEVFMNTLTELARGVEQRADRATLPTLEAVANAFLLKGHEVRESSRARENAAIPRGRLARATVAALGALGTKDARPLLESLAAREDLGVETDVKEILDRM